MTASVGSGSDHARLIRGIIGSLRGLVAPELHSAFAIETLRQIESCLALLVAEEADQTTSDPPAQAELTARVRELFEKNRTQEAASQIADLATALSRVARAHEDVVSDSSVWRGNATDAVTSLGTEALTEYLRRHAGHQTRVDRLVDIPGGRSKATYRLEVTDSELPPQCVLRIDRGEQFLGTRAADEFDVLQLVCQRGGIPAPRPLLAESDATQLGGTFIIVDLVAGKKAGEFFPEAEPFTADRRRVGEQLASVLARLHTTPLDGVTRLRKIAAARPSDYIAEMQGLLEGCSALGLDLPEVQAARHFLMAHRDDAYGPMVFAHGDIGLQNLLLSGDDIVGLLDWELSGIFPVGIDLGGARHLIEWMMPWSDFLEVYRHEGGPANQFTLQHIEFHAVLHGLRAVVASQTARRLFITGQSGDFVLAHAGFELALRARMMLAATVHRALQSSS
jgi:aminoglycoside phosphotransferase (APT) family kinase protein